MKTFLKVVTAWVIIFGLLFVGYQVGGITHTLASTCNVQQVQHYIIQSERPNMGQLEREFWVKAISAAAAKHNLPADVLTAKIAQESKFKASAVSSAGAKGPAQLLPMWTKNFDPFEIELNLDKGAEVLAYELQQTKGNLLMALRRYNGGPRADKIKSTEEYANAIIAKVWIAQKQVCSDAKDK